MKKTLVTVLALVVLALGGCAADPSPWAPSQAAQDLAMSRLQEGLTDNEVIVDPDTGEDLRVVCWRWESYVCTLPNGLPHICRYCVCEQICFGPTPDTCAAPSCDSGI